MSPVLEQQLSELQQKFTHLSTQNAELTSILQKERESNDEKVALLNEAQEKLTNTFKVLSTDALSSNNKNFMQLAGTTFDKFQEAALNPLGQALQKVEGKINDMEKERVGAYQGLRQQVTDLLHSQKELRSETANLVKALRAPNVRGQWGEMQLKRVVEMAGMVAHCDFVEQSSVREESKTLRPDMIVSLPGGKKIVVDAKAPLASYLEALEAKEESVRVQKLQDHARHVRQHIRTLSQKAYWDQFDETPEFVVLFLPGETFFSAALEQDPTLIEVGVKEKVMLATPTTLIALLRAVAYGWRQESIAENARQISELGQELYKRLADMGSHMNRLGRSVGTMVESYNQAVGTLERRVLVTARKFEGLQVASSAKKIEEAKVVEPMPRLVQAPELMAEIEGEDSASSSATAA